MNSIFVLRPIADFDSPDEARQFAIDWQNWQSNQVMSLGEAADYHAYFMTLADRFYLTEEFEENGII